MYHVTREQNALIYVVGASKLQFKPQKEIALI